MKIKCLAPAVRVVITLPIRQIGSYVYSTVGKSRRLKVEEIDNEFLKEGWLPDTVEHGAINSHVISDTAKSGREWTAEQVGYRFSDSNPMFTSERIDLGIQGNQWRAAICQKR